MTARNNMKNLVNIWDQHHYHKVNCHIKVATGMCCLKVLPVGLVLDTVSIKTKFRKKEKKSFISSVLPLKLKTFRH